MHIEGLDEIDNRILTVLKPNARMSYSDIGERVGLSRVAVKSRVQAMEEKGIIQGYHTLIDPSKVPDSIQFFLDVETEPERYNDVVDVIANSKMIRRVYRMTGECRIHAVGLAPNPRELNRYAGFLYDRTEGVRRLRCDTVLSTIKDLDGGVDYVRCEEYEYLENGKQRGRADTGI